MQWTDTAAGVVLAGGRSARMGQPKAALEWHGSTLLYRTAAVLARTVSGPVVVVAAPGQRLPPLPAGVAVLTDPVEGLGPLQGIAAGLAAVADRAPVAFVCCTDTPFLHPAFIRQVLRGLADPEVDVVAPVALGFRQPLTAGYRTALAGLIARLVALGILRPGELFERCVVDSPDDAQLLADPALARLDPELASVLNVNTPQDYASARDVPPPEILVHRLAVPADGDRRGPRTVRAATLGQAAVAVELAPDRPVLAVLNEVQVAFDPQLPLVTGDTVTFRSATTT